MIKISKITNSIPKNNKIISIISANPTRKCEPKKSVKNIIPAIPGKPNPGDFTSNNKPKKPNDIRSGATVGFVKKRTNSSDHVEVIFLV